MKFNTSQFSFLTLALLFQAKSIIASPVVIGSWNGELSVVVEGRNAESNVALQQREPVAQADVDLKHWTGSFYVEVEGRNIV